MTTGQSEDLARRLELVERPFAAPRMPPAGLAVRLKTSMWVRRMLPTRLVVLRAMRRGRRLWERPYDREQALAAMEIVAGASQGGQALTELARAHLVERQAHRALFWQRWTTPDIDRRSAARLREALDGGRGTLLSVCHLGPYSRTSKVAVSMGHAPYVVAGAWFFEQPSADYWGRRLARWLKGAQGIRPVPARGSFDLLRALLERGECVLLYFDMPGRRETSFLGRPAMLADGSARLAAETDALIVPLRMRRVGHRVVQDVGAPLDPRELADVGELHEALARVHERWILQAPAAM
ncbi:MAG TPA: hypothetical protein VES97_03110, partial [Solirubrobacteraceae bacterium]|nr:hypothetical protein [Solirubrobacteraceae bacterium]